MTIDEDIFLQFFARRLDISYGFNDFYSIKEFLRRIDKFGCLILMRPLPL